METHWSARTAQTTDWAETAHRELVNRIIASPTFARSERLCALLNYVCDMAFKGREGELNEQKIGQAVFGRSPDYDSSIDGIVRTQASRLRQRLELYFEQEGAEEPIRVVIPKGGYIPVFTTRQTIDGGTGVASAGSTITDTTPASVLQPPPIRARRITQALPWVLFALMGVMLVAVLIRDHAKTAITTHPLWSQIFVPQQSTLEVPADSGLVLSHIFDQESIPLTSI